VGGQGKRARGRGDIYQGVNAVRIPSLQRNIVATVNLDCRLDLKTIALHARNAEYNPKVRSRFLPARLRAFADPAVHQ
jgi:hypothetical protein